MAIIGVDVDLTVVNTATGWFNWCNELSQYKRTWEDVVFDNGSRPLTYDFRQLFPDVTNKQSLDYWRQADLYNELEPLEASVQMLKELADEGHQIVFVSTLKGNHHKSKYEFCERHYPFLSGFIGTKEKHFARVDVLIDDRIDNLNKVASVGIKPIIYRTPFVQDKQAINMSIIHSWFDLSLSNDGSRYDSLFEKIRIAQ